LKRYLPIAGLVALGLAAPAASQAKVDVLATPEEGDTVTLVSFKTAKCRKSSSKRAKLRFIATARKNGYRLDINIWTNSREETMIYGGDGPADLTLDGPEGNFTNLNRPPDAPGGGGAFRFNRKRTQLGIGFSPAFNEDFSSSVSIAGGLKCQYPKKKRRRR